MPRKVNCVIRLLIVGLLIAVGVTACAPPPPAVTLTVSAAASLTDVFEEIGERFTQQTGIVVTFNFASTGVLAQQIEQGAPVDVFASADTVTVERLTGDGHLLANSVASYAVGRLTLWTRADSPHTFDSLDDLLQDGVNRVAIANPEHAPYGIAARETLQSAGLWETLQPRLIMGENIAQTLQYAETGNVDVALVALSLSIAAGDSGRWFLIPQDLHTPLEQSLGVVSGTSHEAQARQFAAFVMGDEGQAILQSYGFSSASRDVRP